MNHVVVTHMLVVGVEQVMYTSSPSAPIPIMPPPLPTTIPDPGAMPGCDRMTFATASAFVAPCVGTAAVPNPMRIDGLVTLAFEQATAMLVMT